MEPDPSEELFDVLTAAGEPTGQVKPRALVHRDGDWHRAFHCWVVWQGEDGRAEVAMQRRGPSKDTWPDILDVAVGGHFRAGETIHDVIRETDEELGLDVRLDDLVPVGTRRAEHAGAGVVDREIEDVYVCVVPAGLAALRPAPDEITAVVAVAVDDLCRLFDREPAVPARRALVRPDRSLGPAEPVMLTAGDFVPVRDHYWVRGALAAARVLAGERGRLLGV